MILFAPRLHCIDSGRLRSNGKTKRSRIGLKTLLFSVGYLFTLAGMADVPNLVLGSGPAAYPEGTPSLVIIPTITVNDLDNSIASATVQISTGFVVGDILTFTPSGGITGSYDNATGILTLTGVASNTNYKTVLQTVRYANSSSPLNGSRTFSGTVNDGTTSSNTITRTITLNDAPVLSGIEGTPVAYTEDDPATNVTSSLSVNDVDNPTLASATVSISANFSAGDILATTDAFGITSSFAGATLTLTGSATLAEYQTVLRSVTFRNSNTLNPPTATRTITFRVHDGTVQSNGPTRQITLTQVNDAPVISAVAAAILPYSEGNAATTISSALAITDESIASATVQITGNPAPDDVLSLNGTYGPIVNSYDAVTNTLTLSGVTTAANYQNALRNVKYRNTNNNDPSNLTRTVTFLATDASGVQSAAVTTNIPFTAVNDVPVLSGLEAAAISYTEEQLPVTITDLISIADVDNTTLASAKVVISSANASDRLAFTDFGTITSTYASGTLTLTGVAPISDYITALRSVTYYNTNTLNPAAGTRNVTFTVNDGAGNSANAVRGLTIVPVNDAPVLAGMPSTDVAFTEGGTAQTVPSGITITDLDGPSIASAQVAITKNFVAGEDVLSFGSVTGITASYDAATGIATFTGVRIRTDYETMLRSIKYFNSNTAMPSPLTRTLSITVNDGALNSNTLMRNVVVSTKETVTTVEETSFNIAVQGYDPAVNSAIDLSSIVITAVPAHGTATVDNSTGIITYTPDPEFSSGAGSPVTPADVVKFTMKDNSGVLSGVVTYNINVSLINDAPSFVAGPDVVVLEDAATQTLASWATSISDGDPFTPQTLTFNITTDNPGLFQNQPTINASGTLSFKPKSNLFGTATVTVRLTDNGLSTLPHVNSSDTKTFTITVQSVNDTPVANGDTYSTSSVAPLSASVRTSDVEGDVRILTTTPVVAPAHGTVVLNPSGTFTYTPDGSYTGPDSFTYEVCDNGTDNGTPAPRCAQAVISITVNPVNADWNIVGNNSIQLASNSFILTQDLGNQQGAIWNKNPLDLRYSFDLNLKAIFSAEGVVKDTAGADGMVFVFQRDFTPPPLDVPDLPIYARGVYGGNLGVGNITPSFHVEVDTWMNSGTGETDPWYDHISVSTNGNVWQYVGAPVPAVLDATNHAVNIEDGIWHDIRINWDNPTKVLKVYFDGIQKLVVTNDIASQVFGNDPSNVFWGFTAATGGKSNYQALKDIVMTVTNLPPTAVTDLVSVDEDAVLQGTSLLVNDSDPEGGVLAITPETKNTAHGQVVIKADGTFTYTPNHNYNGSDTFTYQVCDNYSASACSTGTVTITINPVQDAPVAGPDVFSTLEDTKLIVTCDCVLINDYDADGDPLTGAVVENVKHGTMVFQPDGTFEYMPDQDFFGTDTFTYTATDGIDTTSPVLVTINVIPVNDPPIAVNDQVEATEDIPTPLPILANDKDVDDVLSTSMVQITTPPQHGTLQITPNEVIYTSSPDYFGPDSFNYTLKDAAGAVSNVATVTINVKPVNDVPIAVNDAAVTPEDTPVSINVLTNDTDVDNALDPTTVTTTSPAHGSVTIKADGTIEYSPAKDYFGSDSFTYTVKDIAGGQSLPATVAITVTPVNDAPVASNDDGTTLENTPVDIPLTNNDTDVDNDINPGTIVITTPPAHGTVSVSPDGVATYVPDTDYLGEDTFSYTVADPDGLISQPATVSITITPPNREPVAMNDGPIKHPFLLDLPIDVLENDYDVDNDHSDIVIQSITQPNMGSVTIEDNKVIYHPQGSTSGVVTFTYTISDPAGLTATATVTIEYVYNPLTVSEGFSPNSDNANDTWYILSIENFPANTVKVFDRWGLLVYQKAGYENTLAPWDGRANVGQQSGKLLDQGTYYYMLDVGTGEIKVLSGFVMITR
ncbi:Ig-like domain-containing protein [Chryseolinea sp. T2]|uniref:tandem-95 repeat protein n=1 Tax=Chryseolinea sp. T2 TaxID=3129255 RepID=UPI00307869C7